MMLSRLHWRTGTLAIVMAANASRIRAAELQPGTLNAWNDYLRQADSRHQQRISGSQPFLWTNESPDRQARVRRGEVVIAPVAGHGTTSIPNGLIHHWIGAIFIPGATIDSFLDVVHDYDNYQHFYPPAVASSRTVACTNAGQEFRMVWQRNVLFVSAAMQGLYQAHDVVLDAKRGYSVAETVEVREIEGYGHPDARLLPPDTGNGFMWRVRSVIRFEQQDGGLFVELEAIALTRDIPASLAWMVKPAVHHLSVNSLTTTLHQTRDAVISSRANPQSLASCRNTVRASNVRTRVEE